MAGPTPAASGRIFISYRREETAYPAGWLYDRLADRFGAGQVFKDVDSIRLGDDFVEVITRAVGSCDVLLALMGDEWLTITDEHGRRRLDDPDDFVRLEIEAALTRDVRVIPVLVGGALMPRADELPESLAKLVRRQALELSPSRFEFDTSRLFRVLDRTLAEVRTAHDDTPLSGVPAGTAPGQSTTAGQEPPGRPEQAQQGHTRTRLPAGSLTPARTWPASGGDEPPDKPRHRLSTRAWIVAGVGGVALILILTVALIAALQRTPSPTEDAFDRQGTTQTGGGIEVDTTSVTSPDGVELSALAAESRRDPGPPLMGDTVTVSYSLTNVGDQPVELAYTFVGVRDPDGNNRDTEEGMNEGQVLAPGETINAQGRILLDSPGTWELWPCYILSDERYCPDKWQLIYVLVE